MHADAFLVLAGLLALGGAWVIWRKAQGLLAPERAALAVGALTSASALLAVLAIALSSEITERGVGFTLADSAALAAALTEGVYLVGLARHGVQGLGLVLLPVVALALLVAPWLPEARELHWIRTNSPIETGHLLLSLLGYAVLTLAAVHAGMQLALDRAFKRRRLSPFVEALPALAEIERHLVAQITWATVLVGASVLTGWMWQWEEGHKIVLWNHKVLFSLFGFGVLVLMLIKRKRARWPATTTSKVTLAAYALILFGYFGVRAIHNLLHP